MPSLQFSFPTINYTDLIRGSTEVEWIVDEIVPRGTTGIVAGEPGIGKTWIFMDLILALATGVEWLQKFPTQRCKVLVVDEENAEVLIRKRFQMLEHHYRPYTGLENIDFIIGQSLDITPAQSKNGDLVPSEDWYRLYATLSDGRYDVVLIDSLTRIHHAEENDSTRMSMLFKFVKMMVDDLGVTVLMTHHFNKGKGRGNYRIRGSSDILAFPDYTLLIDTDQQHRGINTNGIVVEHGKARWGEAVGEFYVKLGGSQISKRITRLSSLTVQQFMYDFLVVPRTRQEIEDELKRIKLTASRSTVTRELAELTEKSVIFQPEPGRYQLLNNPADATAVDDLDFVECEPPE